MATVWENGFARVWLLEAGPSASWFSVSGTITGAWVAKWEYQDADGFPQAAYRLRLWEDVGGVWTLSSDLGWIASSTGYHHGTGLADGTYLITLELVNTDNDSNGYWQAMLVVGTEVPVVDDALPAGQITNLVTGLVVNGVLTLALSATDDRGLSMIRLLIDGATVRTWMPAGIGVLTWSNTYVWDTRVLNNGSHVVALQVVDSSGQTTTAIYSLTLQNDDVPVQGLEAPKVTIQEPLAGATLTGIETIRGYVTDDTGLYRVVLYVDGAAVRTWSPGGSSTRELQLNYALDTSAYADGAHTLSLVAWDIDGKSTTASVAITTSNPAISELVLVTNVLSDSDAWPVVASGLTAKLALVTFQTGEIPEDVRQRYNVSVGYHSPGDSLTWSDYTPITPRRAFVPEIPFRLMLVARPQVVWTEITELTCLSFLRVLLINNRVVLVGNTPASVWELTAAGLTELANLDTLLGVTTITDAVALGDKVYLATDIGPVAFDLDPDDLPLVIQLSASMVACEAVAADPTTAYMLLGTNLYSFAYPQPRLVSSEAAESDTPGGALLYAGGYLYNASADTGEVTDAVYRVDGTALTKLYETAQPVRRLWSRVVEGVTELWAGCDDEIHVSTPQWQLAGTFTGEVYAFAEYQGYIWAAGAIGGLWRYEADGWALFDALIDFVTVWDMTVVDNELLIVGEYADRAAIWKLSTRDGGQFVCGPAPPDVYLTLLTSTRAR